MVTNSRVVVEVLSPSTEAYDRGNKLNWCRALELLEEYVLVSQCTASVQTFFRQPDGAWVFASFTGLEATAKLRSIAVEIALAEIYDGVEFPPPIEPPEDEQRDR